jgi:hypothetical protein
MRIAIVTDAWKPQANGVGCEARSKAPAQQECDRVAAGNHAELAR